MRETRIYKLYWVDERNQIQSKKLSSLEYATVLILRDEGLLKNIILNSYVV